MFNNISQLVLSEFNLGGQQSFYIQLLVKTVFDSFTFSYSIQDSIVMNINQLMYRVPPSPGASNYLRFQVYCRLLQLLACNHMSDACIRFKDQSWEAWDLRGSCLSSSGHLRDSPSGKNLILWSFLLIGPSIPSTASLPCIASCLNLKMVQFYYPRPTNHSNQYF